MMIMRRYNDMIQDMTQDMAQTIFTNNNMACKEFQRKNLNRSTFMNTQGQSLCALFCRTLLILVMLVGVNGVKAQPFIVSTDTDNSGTIEESEKHYYLIQSGQVPTFYCTSISANENTIVKTTNVPSEDMLWYFLDAGIEGTTQYYYIVHKSGRYLYKNTAKDEDDDIKLATTPGANNIDKFYIEATGDYYFIRPKGKNYVNKKAGNVNSGKGLKNSTATDNNSQWKFIAKDDLSWEFPFDFSTANEKNYYKIKNESKTSFYISLNSTQVCTSNAASDDNMVWYFEQVPTEKGSNDYITYCYIVNAETGKYMCFDGTVQNNSQNNACSVQTKTNENETRCQFIVVRSAKTTGPSNNPVVVECYAIIPRLLQEKVWNHHAIGQKNETVGTGVRTYSDRGGGADNLMAQWNFVEFSATCETPNITYSSETGKVSITTETSGAIIHYTTDGMTVPSSTVGTLYEGPFDVSGPTTIMAIATKTAYNPSVVATVSYSQVETPIIHNSDAVSITCATQGATIYYTLGSSTPTTSSSEYTAPLTGIAPGVTINAIAVRNGMINSSVASVTIAIIPDVPTITENCDNTFSLSCGNIPSAAIYYNITTNGDTPADPTTGSTLYDGTPISFDVNYKIKAISYYNNQSSTTVLSYTFNAVHPAPPVITLVGNTATITAVEGVTFYYTTNGTDPTTNSSQYGEAISLQENSDLDIRAIAVKDGKESCVTRVVRPGKPTLTVTDPSCDVTNQVSITGTDDGRTFWYAYTAGNNSEAPAKNTFTQYTGAFSLNDISGISGANAYYTVHAYAKSSDGNYTSDIVSISHPMKTPGTPTLTAPVGSSSDLDINDGMTGDLVVLISYEGTSDNPANYINHTNNLYVGSDGSATFSIPNNATGRLYVSFKRGLWLESCVSTYDIADAPQTPSWSQSADNKLSLSCSTEMAVIYYTLDGTEPTLDNPSVHTYTQGCLDNISENTRIRAKAYLGYRSSNELDYTYTYTYTAVPQFFVDGDVVVIALPADPNADIYYNFSTNDDETIPSAPATATTNSTHYTSSITLTGVTIFSAIAVSNGLNPSIPVQVITRPGYSINEPDDLKKLGQNPDKYFFVLSDIDASQVSDGFTTVSSFTGIIEGNNHTISNLSVPLINSANGAVIHDLNLNNITISVSTASTNVGAFVQNAIGETRIYNCGVLGEESSVSGTAYVGGLVGKLDGSARVINCYSYANIGGGTHRGGIVGYNNVETKSSDIATGGGTMVMNCMFYGDISTTGDAQIAPIYGGKNIHNKRASDNNTGLNNYCYFLYKDQAFLNVNNIVYHGALGAEERFLNRFEFFRLTLNSTSNMAAFYVSGDATETGLIAKWVLDKAIAPYPILKAPGKYPSVMNPDSEHAAAIDPDNIHRNEGRKLGTLKVNIQMGDGAQFNHPGTGETEAKITTSTLYLNITDKDFDNYNFNYKKVQLPYYNSVGTKNYTGNRVVSGWKIIDIKKTVTEEDPYTSANYDYSKDYLIDNDKPYFDDIHNFNFVNRKSSNKDLYSISGRIFNQGAYWEVPDGVTEITIQPYWAKCAYLSDANYDVTYDGNNKYGVTVAGSCSTTYEGQTVNTDLANAMTALESNSSHTVYDYAVVLVGNYHQSTDNALVNDGKPVTFMSADIDGDCEPDNTLFYYHNRRKSVSPIRFDFLNIPGIGTVKRTWNSGTNPQPGIFKPQGWFEVTNTALIRFGQFEYADDGNTVQKTINAPLILQGGIYEQFVSAQVGNKAQNTNYFLIGGNAWFKNFANGCHTSKPLQTPKVPINVTGGDYENFYLTGIYQPDIDPYDENVECYIDGGRFGEVAGAGLQRVDGDVTWLIYGADITNFYGGGINDAQSITGSISTTISNCYVTNFYGGPKFGSMYEEKTITTNAIDCHFNKFYGGGYGGTSLNRIVCEDLEIKANSTPSWSTYIDNHYSRNYETTHHSNAGSGSNNSVNAISTGYDYEYILHSDGSRTVARLIVNFASLSLASTRNVTSNLTGCTINTFYGGGRLGAINGDINSTLTNCTISGNAYGAGESSTVPSCEVMENEGFGEEPKYLRTAGIFNDDQVIFPSKVNYIWSNRSELSTSTPFYDDGDIHEIYTDVLLEGLGKVNGTASITINGKSTIGTQNDATTGNVYGGGELSNVDNTVIEIDGRTVVLGNVFGGGKGEADNFTCDKAMVGIDGAGADEVNYPSGYPDGNTSVNIKNGTIEGNVYGGGEVGRVEMNTTITIGLESGTSTPVVKGSVFGGGKGVETHGYSALVRGNPTVIIQGDAKVRGSVYGGGEIGSVARYKVKTAANDPNAPAGWPMGMPYALKDINSGYCTVTIQGNAEIGPENAMNMITTSGKPDDAGHVFGAGRGILPREYDYVDETHYSGGGSYIIDDHMPSRMDNNGVWEHFTTEPAYIGFIQTLALASETNVTIGGNAFVKGSVYGGSENGIVQYNTHVTIQDNCQIGCGKNTTERYSDAVWADGYTPTTDLECASWAYGKTTGNTTVYLPYDMFDLDANNKPKPASDGHSFYGNVFGGGSGYYPYRRKSAALDGAAWTIDNAKTAEVGQPVDANGYSDGVWLRSAGVVRGNTTVTITGGHILTSVYGGNEQTDVEGSCTVNMSGGTLGVPRTVAQILAHPVTCYLFGAGRGDQRINFNTWNNVASVNVNITGGRIYGSVFGGGEDGHVIGDVALSISGNSTKIGTTGTSYVDGNVFGGGRGFSGEAQTAGTVSGNVTMNISGGEMLGSIYGGGRLASVGTQFTSPEDYNYGNFLEDNDVIKYTQTECDEHNVALNGYIPSGTPLSAAQAEAYNAAMSAEKAENDQLTPQEADLYNAKLDGFITTEDIKIPEGSHGHVIINISGGTIGNDRENKVYTSDINTSGKTDEQIKTARDTEIAGFKETDGIPNTTFEYDAESNKYIVAHTVGGNVFGGSMGRLTLLNGSLNPIWPKMAQVKTTEVNIYGNATIKRNVYGGGELGTVREDAYVTIGGQKTANADANGNVTVSASGSPTINRNVFGGGLGSEDDDTHTIINVYELKENASFPYDQNDYEQHQYAFTPMQFAGCVGQNTYVNVVGGQIKKNAYGGGEIASVGIIDCLVESKSTSSITNSDVVVSQGNSESIIYSHMTDHSRTTDNDGRFLDFGISWPFEFNYVDGFEGATHVKVTGGRLGITGKDIMFEGGIKEDNGDVFGAGKGIAGDYHQYVFCANVGSSDVKIAYNNTSDPSTYKTDNSNCITGSVYAGSENGHVIGDTHLTLSGGLIGHAIYGGGKGKGTYDVWLNIINGVSNITNNNPEDPSSVSAPAKRNNDTEYKATIYSITAGKVFGNTNITMSGGYVMRNVYGGGNMGSVGKGNYSGGPDDYSKTGYGELPPSGKDLWTTSTYNENEVNYAWHFLHSGKSTVTITSGTIGYIDSNDPSKSVKEGLPYGNVFGGCRGESAPNIGETPRYKYSPSSYSGYVNETEVTIGDNNGGPTIFGSVYGGGQDGHVRRDTKVTINNGEIGIAYNPDNKTLLNTSDTEDTQWLHRGNVYGAGSGIGQYTYDFNYDGDYLDEVDYYNTQTKKTTRLKETDYSTSAGSVTRFTYIEIKGGTIHRNVYGGGSVASVGAPKIPYTDNNVLVIPPDPYHKGDTETGHGEGLQSYNEVIISGGQIGDSYSYDNTGNHLYGGNVLAASRGQETLGPSFSTSVWTDLSISGGNIKGDVYGGGEIGAVICGVNVDMLGGSIEHSIYGGGALANTNTSNWGTNDFADGKITTSGKRTTTFNTKLNLLGGTIGGEAYGGGLGRLAGGTEGQPGYIAPVEAMVYGDVFVNLNGLDRNDFDNNTVPSNLSSKVSSIPGSNHEFRINTSGVKGAQVNKIFGGNNLNGTPKGHIKVHVYATQNKDVTKTDIGAKFVKQNLDLTKLTLAEDATQEKVTAFISKLKGILLDNIKFATALSIDVSEQQAIYDDGSVTADNIKEAITDLMEAMDSKIENATDPDAERAKISAMRFDMQAVYGGGNLSEYVYGNGNRITEDVDGTEVVEAARTEVIIDGCDYTSIKQVYGGGNAAATSGSYVRVNETYEIDEVFGGGNGADNYYLLVNNSPVWYENPGANVGYHDFTQVDKTQGNGTKPSPYKTVDQATTPEARTSYAFGSGIATTEIRGGTIHNLYGGSNKRGNIRTAARTSIEDSNDDCPIVISETYGGGKDAPMDAEIDMALDCVKEKVDIIYGGAKNADLYSDVTLNITNGSYGRVFGGNNEGGALYGSITVNIEEKGCVPIEIDELYGGGYLAPYSIYGYQKNNNGDYVLDGDGKLIPLTSGNNPYNNPRINIISATRIGTIYGGGYQAKMVGDPYINVNMQAGKMDVVKVEKKETDNVESGYITHDDVSGKDYVYKDANGHYYTLSSLTPDPNDATKYTTPLTLGYIGTIYGGGNEAEVVGDTHVEIGTGQWITSWNNGVPVYENTTGGRNSATITGDVFGGGDNAAVLHNTNVTIANGSIGNNVYGGGNLGNVGTINTQPNSGGGTDYIWAQNTGGTSVTIIGGTVGPENMNPSTVKNRGNVFGAGKGSAISFECENAMVDHANVNITNGTVRGSVYGGGEIGRTENNTTVTIGTENDNNSTPDIKGNVFGGGAGIETHGYSALVRGNSTVTIQGGSTIGLNVYGGGEIASVGKYKVKKGQNNPEGAPDDVAIGMPYALFNDNLGICSVIIRDAAEVAGNVFGAGKGKEPGTYDYTAPQTDNYHTENYDIDVHMPKRMMNYYDGHNTYYEYYNPTVIWEYFDTREKYLKFIKTLALVTQTDVTIGGYSKVKGSVYGGSENGFVQFKTDVTVQANCEIDEDVFGGGLGLLSFSDAGLVSGNTTVTINGGFIKHNIYGGGKLGSVGTVLETVYHNTKEAASDYSLYDFELSWPVEFKYKDNTGKATVLIEEKNNGKIRIGTTGDDNGDVFGGGKGDVKVDWKALIANTEKWNAIPGNGDEKIINYLARYRSVDEAMIANVKETSVTINIASPQNIDNYINPIKVWDTDDKDYKYKLIIDGSYNKGAEDSDPNNPDLSDDVFTAYNNYSCISGSVYGGAENGHVNENTRVILTDGIIGHAIYGGGKGKGQYQGWLYDDRYNEHNPQGLPRTPKNYQAFNNAINPETDYYERVEGLLGEQIYSLTAGKVYGNTSITMNNGYVIRSIYGGGNLGSIGKGNYAGGIGDYSENGYGERPEGDDANLWTSSYNDENPVTDQNKPDLAYHFLNSGITHIKILGGQVGYVLPDSKLSLFSDINSDDKKKAAAAKLAKKDDLPTGNVFGGCRGQASPSSGQLSPRYMYLPNFFLGYVNNTEVIIGPTGSGNGPKILGSVYGGGQDGHVRRNTDVTVNKATIGLPFKTGDNYSTYTNILGTNLGDTQWENRGNVFGAGSGIGSYSKTNEYGAPVIENDEEVKEYNYSSGSVTCNTSVTINSNAQIYQSVYGGGSLASIGPPKIPNMTIGGVPVNNDEQKSSGSDTELPHISSSSTSVVIDGGTIGTDDNYAVGYGGNVFGGSRGNIYNLPLGDGYAASMYATAIWTDVWAKDGIIKGNVFGGGESGAVKQEAKVTIGVTSTPAPLRTNPAAAVDAGTNAATQSEQQSTVTPAPAAPTGNAATESTGARTISTNRAAQ